MVERSTICLQASGRGRARGEQRYSQQAGATHAARSATRAKGDAMTYANVIRIVTVSDGVSELVVFQQTDGGAEAVIVRGNWSDATRIHIPPPPEGYRVATVSYPGGTREVVYRREE